MSMPDEDVWKMYVEVATKYMAAALGASTLEESSIHLAGAREKLGTALQILNDDIGESNEEADE